MKTKKIFILLICIILVASMLCACPGNNTGTTTTPKPNLDDSLGNLDTNIDDNDKNTDYNESDSTKITFSGSGANVKGMGAATQGSTVRISAAGTYIVSGNSDDGYIIIDASKAEIKLVLDGLTLKNNDGPAILVKNAKKVTLTLAKDKDNVLSDGTSYQLYEGNSIVDGAIFAKSELVINGEGTLTVNGNNAHGIVSKDGIVVTGGVLNVSSKGAGISGKDFVKVTGADITLNAGTDGLKSDNMEDANMGYVYIQGGSFDITSANDGIQAYGVASIESGNFKIKTTSTDSTASAKGIKSVTGIVISGGSFDIDSIDDGVHADGDVYITGGDISVSSGDDGIHANNSLQISDGKINIEKSYEGIEATNIYISGGYVEINSSDDGMNASGGNDTNTTTTTRPGGDMFEATNGSISISGGYVIVHNEGDGIDANGSLEVSGGVVLVDGPSHGGNGFFDYATSAKITGGIVITLGVRDMAQNFSEATQGSILVSTNGSFPAGTVMSLCDEDGNVVLAFTSTKTFSGALFSSPDIEKGKTYTFYRDATVEGLDENGFAYNTTQTGGEECGEVTLDDYICGQGSQMGGRPPR